MKAIPRSGWISHGISLPDVESVADHSYSTCALALLLADLENRRGGRVNVERVLRLAVFHDLPESLTFDISKAYLEYLGHKGEKVKKELEDSAWRHLVKGIDNARIRRTYAPLRAEHVEDKTVESKIVHAADALDILLQVIEYRRRGYPSSLMTGLWNETNKTLSRTDVPSVRSVHAMIRREERKLE